MPSLTNTLPPLGLFPYGKSGLKSCLGTETAGNLRLFPYGKSGLKYLPQSANRVFNGLFPYGKSGLKFALVASGAGECRLFPYGKSGLKFAHNMRLILGRQVSSRMGRVD